MNATKWVSVVLVVASSLMLSGCADLMVSMLRSDPEHPTTNTKILFTATIKNAGSQKAGPSTVGFKVGGETVPAQYEVPALNPGATYFVTRTETLSRPGTYLITVTADFKNQVRESNERNNIRTLSVAVGAP